MTGMGGTLPHVAAFFVFATAFVVYATTASPAIGWLDAPEFVAASASLGVPHSPGHPVPVLIGKLGSLIPVGDLALRVNLMSSAAAAGAVTCVFVAGRTLVGIVAPGFSTRARTWWSAGGALGLAFTWTVWFQGVRAEVYALEGLLMTAALAAILTAMTAARTATHDADAAPSPYDARWLAAAGLLAGLGLATHHFISLTVMVPAAIVLLNRRLRVRTAALTTSLIVLGMAAFLYLPVRSAQHPEVNWGAPHTAERFAWTISAKAFHKTTTTEQVSTRGEDAAQAIATLGEQATWPVFSLALIGMYLGVRRARWRRQAILLGGVLALGVGGRVLIGFDPAIPDDHGYIMPCTVAVFLLALTALGQIAQVIAESMAAKRKRTLALALALAVSSLPIVQLARFHDTASMAKARASDAFAHWEIENLPPRTLLLPAYFQTSFRLWALRATQSARPDIAILDRSFLTYPGADEQAKQRYPDLAGLIDAPLRAGVPTPIETLRAIAQTRPIAVQLHINLEPAVDPWLVPLGGFALFSPALVPEQARRRAEHIDAARRQPIAALWNDIPPGDRRGLRDALLWHDFIRLELFCRQTRLRAAQRTLEDALQLAPDDVTLREQARACGLSVP